MQHTGSAKHAARMRLRNSAAILKRKLHGVKDQEQRRLIELAHYDAIARDKQEARLGGDLDVPAELSHQVHRARHAHAPVQESPVHWTQHEQKVHECSECEEKVYPEDPYYSSPCGTFCSECMHDVHAPVCGVCRRGFDLGPSIAASC